MEAGIDVAATFVVVGGGAFWALLVILQVTVGLTSRRDAAGVRVEVASGRATRQNVLVLLVSFALVVTLTPALGVLTSWLTEGILGRQMWAWLALELVTLGLAIGTMVAVGHLKAKFENDHDDFSTVLRDLRDARARPALDSELQDWRRIIDDLARRRGLPSVADAALVVGGRSREDLDTDATVRPLAAVVELHLGVRERLVEGSRGWDRVLIVSTLITAALGTAAVAWLVLGVDAVTTSWPYVALVAGTGLSAAVGAAYAHRRALVIVTIRVQQHRLRLHAEAALSDLIAASVAAQRTPPPSDVSADALRAVLVEFRSELLAELRRESRTAGIGRLLAIFRAKD